MIEIVIAAMALVAIAVIAFPFVRSSLGSETGAEGEEVGQSEGSPELAALTAQRDALYGAVKEIDFEYALGSLSPEDYRDLRERYKAKTLGVLKAIHDYEDSPRPPVEVPERPSVDANLDAQLEEAVRLRRAQTRATGSRRMCRECGLEYGTEDNFCPNCGRRLALACPECGEDCGPGDQFCARCGAKVGTAANAPARRAAASGRR